MAELSNQERRFRKISNKTGQRRFWRSNILDADIQWLVWAEKRITSIAGKDGEIDRESFKNALEIRNVFFADRFFDLFDHDFSGTVSVREMMDGLFLLNKGTKEEKLRFFFDVYDLDETGTIDKGELRVMVQTGMDESSVKVSDSKLDHLTDTLFSSADENNDGSITFEEFMMTMRRYPDLFENFTISAASWLKDTKTKRASWFGRGIPFILPYLRNNLKRIVFMLCFLLINAALFVEAAYRHSSNPDANWCFLIARGCGQALNFDSAFVGVMMLRKALSFLRAAWLRHVLPFDDTINIHKAIGYTAAVLALLHTAGHIGNAVILETYKNFTAAELLFTKPGLLPVGLRVGKLAGSAFITGWILDVVFLILIVGSLSFVRRSGHFQVFYWTHKLCYWAFWFLLILHGPNFWCWFIGPALLLLLEKVSDMKVVRTIRFGKTYVREANLLPSGVTHLVLTKPRNLKYKAGDYIFIQIQDVAKHEWHPFTISSAPEQQDISLHIRSAGNWTKRLYQFFDEMQDTARKMDINTKGHASSPAPVEKHRHNGEYVNQSFEMTGEDVGREENGERPVSPIRDTVIKVGPEDITLDPDNDDDVEPPTVMTVRRLSFNADVDLKALMRSRSVPGGLGEIQEESEMEDSSEPEKTPESNQDDLDEKTEQDTSKDAQKEENSAVISTDPLPTKTSTETASALDTTDKVRRTSKLARMLSPRRITKKQSKQNVLFDMSTNSKIQVYIQGPYGTPSTTIFQSEHAVLIGAGIGVTPFASIIQSIICKHRTIVNKCPNCTHSWVDEERQRQALRVKKVDFVWLNRNHTAFEWFVDMLTNLEDEQSNYSLDRFLDIHLFMTGLQRLDIKNFGLQMALDLVHQQEHRDILTGLRTKLQAGRPDWSKLFQRIKNEKKGKVSVFFCGAPALGAVIRKHCSAFGFRFHKESF